MNLKSISASVCITTGALLSFSTSAHAITFTTGGTTVANEGLYTSVAGATTTNFNTAPNSAPAFSTTYTDGIATFTQDTNGLLVRNSTQTTTSYAPANDTSRYLITGGYYDQGNTGYTPGGNTASGISTFHDRININFSNNNTTGGINYFGLYWGLINETNQIQFYSGIDGTGTLLSTTGAGTEVTGNELGIAGVTPGASGPSGYVNFFTATGETIRSVRLSNVGSTSTSPGNGFEFDNVSHRAVPWTPSPILDLLGLGALGAVVWLKRQQRNNSKLLSRLWLKSKLS